jgi:hypothetical protein
MMAEVSDIRALTGPTAWRPFLTALLATGLASCGGPPESSEQQLRAWVDRGQTYSDARGNSRDDIENLFRFYFLRAKNVGLLVGIDDIEIFDDSAARVMLTVAMGATTDAVLGFNADAYEFELDLENAGGEWLLVSGRWTDVGNELR